MYDLAALAERDGDFPEAARDTFERKARAKGLKPEDLAGRLVVREEKLQRLWTDRLRDQVTEVTEFESTWRAVRRAFRHADYI